MYIFICHKNKKKETIYNNLLLATLNESNLNRFAEHIGNFK